MEITAALVDRLAAAGMAPALRTWRLPGVGRLMRARVNEGLALVPARRWARALEIGYGPGLTLCALAAAARALCGADPEADPDKVGRALRACGCDAALVRAAPPALPFEAGAFDLVVCLCAEDLLADEASVRDAVRVCAPGGAMLLGMSVARYPHGGERALGGGRASPSEALESALRACGARVAATRAFAKVAPGLEPYRYWLVG